MGIKIEANARDLLAVFETIAALVTEARFHFRADGGFSVRAVDTGNVAMISMEVSAEAFHQCRCTANEEIGVEVSGIRDMLKRICGSRILGPVARVTLERTDKLLVLSVKDFEYWVRRLDVDTIRKDPNPPNLELPCGARMCGELLTETLLSAASCGDKVVFEAKQLSGVWTLLISTASSDDMSRFSSKFVAREEKEVVSPKCGKAMFSLDYLKDMAPSMRRAPIVSVGFGDDRPVKFNFESVSGVDVTYLLAPRIEAD